MVQNPLQQYFRQPKIWVGLPSNGVYSEPGTFDGDVSNMPIFGMTGMDEIILKTPDALITGESTVKIIQSCCPAIKNAWNISNNDTNLLYAAIKIATYGNTISVNHTCPSCSTTHDYDVDLNFIVEFYNNCKYDNILKLGDLVVKTKPLTYKQSTDLAIKGFKLRQQLGQLDFLETDDEKNSAIKKLFEELSTVQHELYLYSVEQVEMGETVVTEQEFIVDWLKNCDKSYYDMIKEHIEKNRMTWDLPSFPVQCTDCTAESRIFIELDQSNFFEKA